MKKKGVKKLEKLLSNCKNAVSCRGSGAVKRTGLKRPFLEPCKTKRFYEASQSFALQGRKTLGKKSSQNAIIVDKRPGAIPWLSAFGGSNPPLCTALSFLWKRKVQAS